MVDGAAHVEACHVFESYAEGGSSSIEAAEVASEGPVEGE